VTAPPTNALDPISRQEVRLVRLEEQVKALSEDVAELKTELREFRSALISELRASHQAKQKRTELWLAVLQPKTLIPLAVIIVSVIAATSGLVFSWGDIQIGQEP